MRADMFYCDRCGKLFDKKDFKDADDIMGIISYVDGNETVRDLCPECEDDLERWFMDAKNKQRGGDEDVDEIREV